MILKRFVLTLMTCCVIIAGFAGTLYAQCNPDCQTCCELAPIPPYDVVLPSNGELLLTVTLTQNINGTLHFTVVNDSPGDTFNLTITTTFGECTESQAFPGVAPSGVINADFLHCPCPTLTPQGTIVIQVLDANTGGLVVTDTHDFTLCCGCTRSTEYWSCHLSCWPVDPNTLFCDLIAQLQSLGIFSCPSCAPDPEPNLTLADIMTNPSDSLWYCLAKEWIAAYINIIDVYGDFTQEYSACLAVGACGIPAPGSAFVVVGNLLVGTLCTQEIVESQVSIATCLKKNLARFNLGLAEGATCPNYCDTCNAGETCPANCATSCFQCRFACNLCKCPA